MTYKQMIQEMRDVCLYNMDGKPCLSHYRDPRSFCEECRLVWEDYLAEVGDEPL